MAIKKVGQKHVVSQDTMTGSCNECGAIYECLRSDCELLHPISEGNYVIQCQSVKCGENHPPRKVSMTKKEYDTSCGR